MKRHLVISDHWIGDTIKTQTVCQILKEEDPNCIVDFVTKWPQLYILLQHNPFIDKVILVEETNSLPINILNQQYDSVRRNSGRNWVPNITPGELYQKNCGIEFPRKQFKIYTDSEYDTAAKNELDELRRKNPGKILVAVDLSWRGRKKSTNNIQPINIMNIIKSLSDKYVFVPVGIPVDPASPVPVQIKSAREDINKSCHEFTSVASIIKNCDVLLASESGILNLGIGIQTTPIIYAKDFLYALAGPSGSFGSSDTPEKFMGPEAYEGVIYVDTLHQDLTDETYLEHIDAALEKLQKHLNK